MQLLPLRKNSATWDSIGYHVSDDARRLLLHGSLHSLAQGAEVRAVAMSVLMHHRAACCRVSFRSYAPCSHRGTK